MDDSKLAALARSIDGWRGLVSGPAEPLVRDCLVLVEHLGDARNIVDVGSGGGLPGLVLKIARPQLDVTLIEADAAKAAFLVHATALLELDRVQVVNRRAEEAAQDPALREAFDVAVARALAPMPVVAELCLGFVRVGGRLLAQKTAGEDVGAAARAIEVMGGGPARTVAAPSELRESGTIVIVDKIHRTPEGYPRRAGLPGRKPL